MKYFTVRAKTTVEGSDWCASTCGNVGLSLITNLYPIKILILPLGTTLQSDLDVNLYFLIIQNELMSGWLKDRRHSPPIHVVLPSPSVNMLPLLPWALQTKVDCFWMCLCLSFLFLHDWVSMFVFFCPCNFTSCLPGRYPRACWYIVCRGSVEMAMLIFRHALYELCTASNSARVIVVPAQTYVHCINTQ